LDAAQRSIAPVACAPSWLSHLLSSSKGTVRIAGLAPVPRQGRAVQLRSQSP
jgi:hypothetical protein